MDTLHTLCLVTDLFGPWDFDFSKESLNVIQHNGLDFKDRLPVPMAFDALAV